jgi:Domain of unknown function (DUF4440)
MTNYYAALAGLTLLNLAGLTHAQAPTSSVATHADCAIASTPNQKKDEDTIRRIEHDWLTAEYRGNPQFLECLLEPDYRTSGRDGRIRSRDDVIGRVRETTDFTRAVPTLESIVFVHGDAATAHSIMHTTDKAGNPREVHFVDAYTFHDGRWHAYSGADL